jgi:hypothetical protein
VPLTPEEQASIDERFEALEDRNAKLERLIKSSRAFTQNPLALATDLDDLGSVKTHLDFEEAPQTPVDPPAEVVRLSGVADGGATRLVTRNDAGVGVPRYIWAGLMENYRGGTGSPTPVVIGAWPVGVYGWSFPGGGTTDGIQSYMVALPSDWVSGTVEATAFYQGAAANTNNRRIEMVLTAITPGADSINKTVDVTERKTVPHGNSILTAATFSTGVLTVAAGDLIRVAFARASGDGLDTNTDAMYLFGIRLSYTAFL